MNLIGWVPGWRTATAAAAALVLAGPAGAGTILPTAVLMVDDSRMTVEVKLSEDGKTYVIGRQTLETAEGSLTIDGSFNPDPSLAYGLVATDFGAPSNFAFLFSGVIVPTANPTAVNASIVGGLTDTTGNGVSLTPTAAKAQVNLLGPAATNAGVDVGNALIVGAGPPGSLYAYGPFAAGPQAGPAGGPFTSIDVTTSFALSGGGDIAVLTGFFNIAPQAVPEPASLDLAGAGAVGLLGLARRRFGL